MQVSVRRKRVSAGQRYIERSIDVTGAREQGRDGDGMEMGWNIQCGVGRRVVKARVEETG